MGINIGNILGSLGKNIFGNLGSEIGNVVNSPIGKAGLNLLEELAKSVFAGAKDASGNFAGPIAPTIDLGFMKIPDPLAKFNPTLLGLGQKVTKAADLLGKLGQFLTGGMSALENGKSVSVPSLPERAGTDAAASQQVAQQIASGSYNTGVSPYASSAKQVTGSNAAGFAATGGSGSSSSANLFGGGSLNTDLTSDQQQALSGLSGQEKSRMEAQFRMQNKAELISFISNMMKMQHDMQMAVINNIRS